MMELNNSNPNIKFTYEFSEASINFLDLNVKFSNGKLQTSLYVKPTDCHQYFDFQLGHAKHTKMSVIYSQTLRVSRACSQEIDCKDYCNQMKSEAAKLHGLLGNVGYAGAWVAWVKFLLGLRGLSGSTYFLQGSRCYVGCVD